MKKEMEEKNKKILEIEMNRNQRIFSAFYKNSSNKTSSKLNENINNDLTSYKLE